MKKTGTFFLNRDNLQLGLVLGLILPALVFLAIYLIRFSNFTLDEFINYFTTEKRMVTFFGVWCLVANIALFTYYVNTNRDRTARGIFIVTLFYGIGVLLAKVLM
ncbi:MAG: hypothetical protein ACO1OO_00455 [Flavisolibacter sp.]